MCFFVQAEDGIRYLVRSRGLGDVYKRQLVQYEMAKRWNGQMPQVTGGAMPMLQLPGAGKPDLSLIHI